MRVLRTLDMACGERRLAPTGLRQLETTVEQHPVRIMQMGGQGGGVDESAMFHL